jgi:hypothetical protein
MSLCMRSFPPEKEGKEHLVAEERKALEGGEKGVFGLFDHTTF